MIKQLALSLCLSLPLVAMAAHDAKPVNTARPAKAAKAASAASAPQAPASASAPADHNVRKAEITQQHSRGTVMGACLKQATDQGLSGAERKKFIGTCAAAGGR